MSKKRVDLYLNKAREALIKCEIANADKIDKTVYKIDKNFRSHISSFGAAVLMGSLKSAVAVYAKQGNAKTDRSVLLTAIHYILTGDIKTPDEIFKCICVETNITERQAEWLDASIALKLSMNFFDMGQEDT